MAWSGSDVNLAGRRFSRVQRSVVWLRGRRDLVIALTIAGVAVAFALDLLIPGYAIAGLYLLPLLLVAFALGEERAVVFIGVLCLGLTVFTMVLQGRTNSQNVMLVVFGALAGAGMVGLGYLYQRFDQLYERERSTTARLHALADQLQRLQEVSVLDSDRPLSELLLDIVVQAQQLLGSDGGRLFRLDAAARSLTLEAEVGSPNGVCSPSLPVGDGVIGAAIATRRAAVFPIRRPAAGHVEPGNGSFGQPRQGLSVRAAGGARRRVGRHRALLRQPAAVRRRRHRPGVVVRRPGGARHRERPAARAGGAQRRRRPSVPGSRVSFTTP